MLNSNNQRENKDYPPPVSYFETIPESLEISPQKPVVYQEAHPAEYHQDGQGVFYELVIGMSGQAVEFYTAVVRGEAAGR